MRHRIRIATALGGAALLAGTLSACTSGSCVDWIFFEDSTAMAADADAIVVGTVEETGRTVPLYGYRARLLDVDVETIEQGDDVPDDLTVIETPQTCGEPRADRHAEHALLDRGEPVRLYLRLQEDGTYELMTGMQGVEAA